MKEPDSTVQKGRRGEQRACDFLTQRNFKIIKRNFNYPGGEVDIIAVEHSTLHFIEVKAWADTPVFELERAVNCNKLRKIKRGVRYFFEQPNNFSDHSIQIDVLFINVKTKTIDFYEDIG
ncbi:YraN family protein [Spirochaeta lutea]|uniref:YraN family protein n=1 Tax=Spirochaeta lutea TaxID=1480694 RepID=UPI00068F43CF|nr:YraN family protein [Spirochaeta lutea]